MTRVAVLDRDKCRPKDCDRICYRFCPMVRSRVEAIKFESEDGKPIIVEALCTGCGICVKKCPFGALDIVNLPDELEEECSHRYGVNAFKLYRLPTPMPGKVLGLLGKNGTGKTTALRILAGEIKPNLGRLDVPPSWEEVARHFRGSTLYDYFMRLAKGKLKVIHKPQYITRIPRLISGSVGEVLSRIDERGVKDQVAERLELKKLWDRPVKVLSGGEAQRLAVAAALCREGDVYVFDEPSSYLDVRQRLNVARAIRSLKDAGKTVLVAEHDIAMLDYLSDNVCLIYGSPGVYGIVSLPYGVRTGINIYLEGYLPSDNVRFRREPIRFHVKPPPLAREYETPLYQWTELEKSYGDFHLKVSPGSLHVGEVVGVLGPNGIGKTTFIRLLAGEDKPDRGEFLTLPEEAAISYKPQYVSADYPGTVEQLLREAAGEEYSTERFKAEILSPLGLARLLDREVSELSGGELQKVAVAACLSKKATVYLLDEPSAFLDVEERLAMARVVRRNVESMKASALVIEHDIVVQDFMADRLMVFLGEPGRQGEASPPLNLREGMNRFLGSLGVTFRRDPQTGRPRVNKEGSKLDRMQKELGEYYYVPVRPVEEEEEE
ncbi:MAG: ribosome biogenesis/translation initiation ATPase RLI [Candidatus Hecatellales archaeon]|nr:MAG: ribosome biogenesis/translation initiation ATPase RLI [Candidatus Hecatellales archaeon]